MVAAETDRPLLRLRGADRMFTQIAEEMAARLREARERENS